MKKIECTIFDSINEYEYITNNVQECSVEESMQIAYEDFWNNINYSKYNKIPCIIIGKLGLWNGKKDIVPVKTDNLFSAIKRCITISIEDIVVKQNGNVIEVNCYHHDGINYFEIRFLTKLGYNKKNFTNEDIANKKYVRQNINWII